VNYEVAEDKELPSEFTRTLWGKPIGLAIISAASVLLAVSVDLESISTSGSVGFLLIFAMVNLVGYKKAKEINGKKIISLFAAILCFAAFVILLIQQLETSPVGIYIAIGVFTSCFIAEYIFKKAFN
jgi:cytosine/uracil/thiamine/allantoin permease